MGVYEQEREDKIKKLWAGLGFEQAGNEKGRGGKGKGVCIVVHSARVSLISLSSPCVWKIVCIIADHMDIERNRPGWAYGALRQASFRL